MKLITKQRHANVCGAIAIANAMKLTGRNVTYKQAVRMCGGLKKLEDGMSIDEMMKVLRKKKYSCFPCLLTLKEAKWFAKQQGFAVIVAYVSGVIKFGKFSVSTAHAIALNKNGKALNDPYFDTHYRTICRMTKKHWKKGPITIIVKEKE